VDRSPPGATELVGVAVSARRQRLKRTERSRFSLKERTACARHGHPQEGTGAAEVDQVQAIGSKPRGEDQIQGVEVGGPVALHGAA